MLRFHPHTLLAWHEYERGGRAMEVLYRRGAGLDVHTQTVMACVLTSTAKGMAGREVETFGPMTRDLERLARWLADRDVAQVALEATGV